MKKCLFPLILPAAALFVLAACGGVPGAAVQHAPAEPPGATMIIRFSYHSQELDPYFNLLPEAYLYIIEEISQAGWEGEFIRLMFLHTGISVTRLWFEGGKLYVDLHEYEIIWFDHGTTGSYHRGQLLNRTLASIPGVASFEVLVGGARGAQTSHFSFNYVAIVENGEIARFEWFYD